jgi:hypothetical protein
MSAITKSRSGLPVRGKTDDGGKFKSDGLLGDSGVTLGRHDLAMPSPPAPTGVCILRVNVQPQGLLITLTVNRDIGNASTEPTVHFSDIREATTAVVAFLESFRHAGQP